MGPVPDFVMDSAGNLGAWTPRGKWDKKVKKEQKKKTVAAERGLLGRGQDDPSLPINQLPYNCEVTLYFCRIL